jgi:hypothetical protein
VRNAITPLVLLLCAVATPARGECYTVYDRASRIVYRSELTPIDLSGPIRAGLQKTFPGGQLVISGDVQRCTRIEPSSPVDPMTGAAAPADTAPTRVPMKPAATAG